MTQMAEALRAAGIKTARDRLQEIALKTVISHPGSSRQAVEQEIWQTIRKSVTLMQELFDGHWYKDAVRILVDHALQDASHAHYVLSKEAEPEPRTQPKTPVAFNRWKTERDEARRFLEERRQAVKPIERRAGIVANEWLDRERKELEARRKAYEEEQRKEREISYRRWCRQNGYLLDDKGNAIIPAAFLTQINDKPFWEVTTNEARGWVERTEHSTRFIELVISGLPDDGRPIEYYRKPFEIETLWEQAKLKP
jgi:hypothetical protein